MGRRSSTTATHPLNVMLTDELSLSPLVLPDNINETIDTFDRRLFHPDPESFSPGRVVVRRSRDPRKDAYYFKSSVFGFESPRQVSICVRRKQRREVLFARNRAGGGGRRKRPKFTEYSRVRC